MLNYIKKIFTKKDGDKMVHVLQYPDKIIVETWHKTDTGIYIKSSDFSILSKDISAIELGKIVLNHLNLSKSGINYKKFDHKKSAEDYKKITGLKTIKAQMLNSKNLSITLKDEIYNFVPYKNGGSKGDNRGYTPKSEFARSMNNLDAENLGIEINKMWQYCE